MLLFCIYVFYINLILNISVFLCFWCFDLAPCDLIYPCHIIHSYQTSSSDFIQMHCYPMFSCCPRLTNLIKAPLSVILMDIMTCPLSICLILPKKHQSVFTEIRKSNVMVCCCISDSPKNYILRCFVLRQKHVSQKKQPRFINDACDFI